MRPKMHWFGALLLTTLLWLSGCANEYEAAIQEAYPQAGERLELLGANLDSKALANARIVEHYAQRLSILKPELTPIAETLAKDVTRQGSLFQQLQQRYLALNQHPQNGKEYQQALHDLESLYVATDLAVFNDSLLDLVNTLADLSEGELKRIDIPADSAKSELPGSYLVGNPAYGQWQTDSNGDSFWQFVGPYLLLSAIVDEVGDAMERRDRRIYYSNWYSQPRYSYYNDYGWKSYGSYKDYNRHSTLKQQAADKGKALAAPPPKQYGSASGQKRMSSYLTRTSERNSSYGKRMGAGDGPRHADIPAKRGSTLFAANNSHSSSRSPPKRSSALFSSSSRSSSSRSSSGFGGK
ncbi:hypothetical protein D5085_05445 [Ectothiorhodospiraceae bacterium BW-2]|nr:hypothetical protein D5085_05445 [Ectothiorhodospiraceae bacterium BW-2]